jgi:hypothetical protein
MTTTETITIYPDTPNRGPMMTRTQAERRAWGQAPDEAGGLIWASRDGRAMVAILRQPEGWRVEVYEATGRDLLGDPCSYIGSEPLSPTRAGAVAVARRWVRKLTRPRLV